MKIYISGGNALEKEINAFNDARWHSFYTAWGRCLRGDGCILCLMTGKGCYMMKQKIWE